MNDSARIISLLVVLAVGVAAGCGDEPSTVDSPQASIDEITASAPATSTSPVPTTGADVSVDIPASATPEHERGAGSTEGAANWGQPRPYIPASEYRPAVEDRFPPTGVADAFEQPVVSVADDAGADRELEIVGCRWRSPGYVAVDARWSGTATTATPIHLTLWRQDVGNGASGLVALAGPGEFSVTFDFNGIPLWDGTPENIENELDNVYIDRDGMGRFSRRECSIADSNRHVSMSADPIPTAVTALEGTADWFAQTLVDGPDANLVPFGYFVAYRGWNGFDRIHVAPDYPMTFMSVDVHPSSDILGFDDSSSEQDDIGQWGRCAEIRSGYDVSGETVYVTEIYGCDPQPEWIENPALVEADDPGDLIGILGSDQPDEFVAVVGPQQAAQQIANNLVRATINDIATG
jgi:hypothetical protein